MNAVSVIAGSLGPVNPAGDTSRNVPTNLQETPVQPTSARRGPPPPPPPSDALKQDAQGSPKVSQPDTSGAGNRSGGDRPDDPMYSQFVQQRSFFRHQSADPKPWARFL